MRMCIPPFSPFGFRCFFLLLVICACTSAFPQRDSDEVTPEVQRLYAEAKAARQQGDSATAIEKYKAILERAPHLAAAYNNLGMLYFDNHEYARAVEVLERGLQLNPQMPGASAMLGMSYFQLGQDQKAKPFLETALRANPQDDQVEMVLIKVLASEQKTQEAAS